jgi:hypothetical protein
MRRLLLAALIGLTGCGAGLPQTTDKADTFRNVVPSKQGIDIKVPGSAGQALTSGDEIGSQQQALLNQKAGLYELTRVTTVAVNTWTWVWLKLLDDIVKVPPTTLDDTHAVWGPGNDGPLAQNIYRFTVTKVATGYDYTLEAKGKSDPDTAYLTIIDGHHTPGSSEKFGDGTFTLYWDRAQALPEHDANVLGTGIFTYSRNEHWDVTVGVKFQQVKDQDTGKRVDANYAFSQVQGGEGSFEFMLWKDMTTVPNDTPAPERQAIKSRWKNDGAGRSDVKFSQGDLTVEVTASECWGATFLETYYKDSLGLTAQQGQETDCAFAAAEYTALQ